VQGSTSGSSAVDVVSAFSGFSTSSCCRIKLKPQD
jgi:hypothetical protein